MPTLRHLPPAALASVAGAALCFAAALAVPNRAAAKDEKPTAPTPALTVTTTQPSSTSLPLGLNANGSVAAWQEAVIGSESNGLRLLDVRVNVGDVVKKGDTLAVFASETVRADVEQARAALQEAQANASEAKANADRARALRSSGALSEQQITQYFTAERTAAARVNAAKATLEQQNLRLRFATVTAPDSGIISARSATVGAVIGGGTELFRMIRQGRLEWRAEITSADLGRIKPGMRAAVRAASGSEISGKVRAVAPTVDPQTRLALVYVDLPPSLSANAPLKAGMFASGRFELGKSNALTVPQQAVAVRDGFSYVFRLNRDSRVSQLKVSTGRRLGDQVEIVGGLAAGTPIVVSGAGFLNDGDLVRNVPTPIPAKPAPRQTAAR
ncbi:efflux RND transporter periplasmic adaptor subunit [Telluria aromaticivorans]|uniref:Efflux RND transporter periplasmic adaptor subunit n=1 Tax=Telluria aromaticivorans TaxID=2725995 RepID=A0A7Y2NZ83_9BURK|nr:efflux RND transporter periplasmic adaptor subunit [Telluria aromaticivorans]NNG22873.1 efflux RND transporter periplasmic adaptor subunit [Telluria aromaticivorans]